MSKLTYTVIPFGLLKLEDRPTKAKKVGKGLLEQIEELHPHRDINVGEIEDTLLEIFDREERPERSFRMITGSAGMAQFNRALEQGFRDQLITGESRYIIGVDTADVSSESLPTITTINPHTEVLRITSTGETITNRQRQQQALLTQLNTGQISAITYLDLISNL